MTTKTPQPRKLEYWTLDNVVGADRNPKLHDIENLTASMNRFGFLEPLVHDGRTGKLISGHGRLETLAAAEAAGLDPPEGIIVSRGKWQVPIVLGWSSANDEEAAGALIVVNRLVERGGWDMPELSAMLVDLQAGAGLDGIGWAGPDLDELLASLAPEAPPHKTDPDDAPLLPLKVTTKRNDVWLLGRHRLICGDATLPATIAAVAPNGADMIVTDPPYCSGGFQESKRASGSIGSNPKVKRTIANDTLSTRGYIALIRAVLSACGDVPMCYMFTDWRMWVNLFDITESSGFGVRNMIVWDKGTPGMGAGWRAQHELIMYSVKATIKFDNHKAQGNVIQSQRTGNLLHATQKPVDLLEKIIAVSDMSPTILDPFAGSGSTLIAADRAGRTCYGVELTPAICDVVCLRYQNATGIVPVLERTGKAVEFS